MRRLALLCLPVVAASAATPAAMPDFAGLGSVDRARATMIAYGECAIRLNRGSVEQALAASPVGSTGRAVLDHIAYSECPHFGGLSANAMLMRGALFSALYRTDFAAAAPPLADMRLNYANDVGGTGTAERQQYVGLRQFAECVVRADPFSSRAFVLAPVGSAADRSAFVALASRFNPCLTKGVELTFSKTVLAGLIAETLYRQSLVGAEMAAASRKP